MARSSSFRGFRILSRCHNTERVELPPDFMDQIKKEPTYNKAVLLGPSHLLVEVSLHQEAERVFLEDGWPTFLVENSVDLNDCLEFTYLGKWSFFVEIYDKNGRGKYETRKSANAPEIARIGNDAVGVYPREDDDVDDSSHIVDSSNCETFKRSNAEKLPVATPSDAKRKRGRPRKIKDVNEAEAALVKRKRGRPRKEPPIPTSPEPTMEDIQRALDKSDAFEPDGRPYYKLSLDKFSLTRFMVPLNRRFTRIFFPLGRTECILQNSKGEEWEGRVSHTHVGHSLVKGWRQFAIANKLRIGDVCVFQFFMEENQNVVIKIHVYHWMEEPSGTDDGTDAAVIAGAT